MELLEALVIGTIALLVANIAALLHVSEEG